MFIIAKCGKELAVTTFLTEEATCPICDTPMKVNHLTSTNTFGGQETDFRQHAAGFDPLYIVMNTCPTCGYSDFSEFFSKPRPLSDTVKQQIREHLGPVEDRAMGYVYAARIAGWRGAPPLEIANLYQRAAWCCADQNDREGESTYRLAAIEHFEQALAQNQLANNPPAVMMYLVGELYRRVGQTDTAREWFDKVLAADNLGDELAWVKTTAQQQRDDPKDRFR
jgi:uncharacterized protein